MELKIFTEESTEILDRMREGRVYIYGDGDYAYDLERFFRKMGVTVAAHLVDDPYFEKANPRHNVRRLSSALPSVNEGTALLVWGIAKPSKLKDAMGKTEIKKAYLTYDCIRMWQDRQYAHKQAAAFQAARELFADALSQKTFDDYLKLYNGDLSGDLENIVDGTYYNELTRSVLSGGGHSSTAVPTTATPPSRFSDSTGAREKCLPLSRTRRITMRWCKTSPDWMSCRSVRASGARTPCCILRRGAICRPASSRRAASRSR